MKGAPYRVTRYKESLYLTCLNAPRLGQQVIVYAAGAENTTQILPWMILVWKSPLRSYIVTYIYTWVATEHPLCPNREELLT